METNYFGKLLIELSDHIKAQVPEIAWIDQDLGQLETFEYRPEVDFPCVLIDFQNTTYSELVELAQMGDVTVVIRVATAPFSESYQAAPLSVREQALRFYELEQKVYEAVQGFHNDFTNPFIRAGAGTENREDTLRVRVLTFNTTYEDYSALPMNEKHPADLDVDTERI